MHTSGLGGQASSTGTDAPSKSNRSAHKDKTCRLQVPGRRGIFNAKGRRSVSDSDATVGRASGMLTVPAISVSASSPSPGREFALNPRHGDNTHGLSGDRFKAVAYARTGRGSLDIQSSATFHSWRGFSSQRQAPAFQPPSFKRGYLNLPSGGA